MSNLQHPTITITQASPARPTMGTNNTDAMDGNLNNPPLQTSPVAGSVNAGLKTNKIAGILAPTPSNDANALSSSGINILSSLPSPTLPNTVPTLNMKPKGKSKSGVPYKDTGTLTARFINLQSMLLHTC